MDMSRTRKAKLGSDLASRPGVGANKHGMGRGRVHKVPDSVGFGRVI